jgi:cytochrome c peroxidase
MKNRSSLLLVAAALVFPACRTQSSASIDPTTLTAFAPLPAAMESPSNPLTLTKENLGRTLYYDARLSLNNNISCNSCHDLSAYGVDGRRVSPGTNKQLGARNSPTVYNAAAHLAQFWDGRASTVEEQAKGPILNPVEMGMPSGAVVLERLRAVPAYRDAFRAAFPRQANPITYENVGLAIGAFERRLVTPGAWDRFLSGDTTALTPAERRGFNTFVAVGCTACHSGALLGGSMYQKLGAAQAWPDTSDVGRAAITHQASDAMVFKVPSLRNVEHTGPYFHNGSVARLHEAVRLMGKYQLGRDISDDQATQIMAFLHSLTGEMPAAYAAPRAVEQ